MLRLPIGYDDFREIVEEGCDFVDKTLFIKELIDDFSIKIKVITRPRRFGKTLNLSMLQYFFADIVNGQYTKGIFDGLKISKIDDGSYMEHQGKYPVIFITLKGIKEANFELALSKMRILIQKIFRNYYYLQDSINLRDPEKELFNKYLSGEISQVEIENSLYLLSELLYKHHKKKVWILIDEYDTPIQSGYLNDYYEEIIQIIREMFGAALKTNPYLEKGIITGILRVAKESIFSDLNNVKVYSILDKKYSEYFGFTEEEVSDLLVKAKLGEKSEEIRLWYNGYIFGKTVLYNPWSIVNCINEEGMLKPYWVNTSGNDLIKTLLINMQEDAKEKLNILFSGNAITAIINEHAVFDSLKNSYASAWSLMVMAGYLKIKSIIEDRPGGTLCELEIPNLEVRNLYIQFIEEWLAKDNSLDWYNEFLDYLLNGRIEKLGEYLESILLNIVSVRDTAQKPEAFYHGLLLGFSASLDKNRYEVSSNKESGAGFYDIIIFTKDLTKPSFIIELKSVKIKGILDIDEDDEEVLNGVYERLGIEAENALKQIDKRQYSTLLEGKCAKNIIKIGIAFSGKKLKIQYNFDDLYKILD